MLPRRRGGNDLARAPGLSKLGALAGDRRGGPTRPGYELSLAAAARGPLPVTIISTRNGARRAAAAGCTAAVAVDGARAGRARGVGAPPPRLA